MSLTETWKGLRCTVRKKGRNRLMNPKKAADSLFKSGSSKVPARGLFSRGDGLLADEPDLEGYDEGAWNTGEWRAVGAGRAKGLGGSGAGGSGRAAEGAASVAVDTVRPRAGVAKPGSRAADVGAAPLPPKPVAIRRGSQRAKVAILLAVTLVLVLLGLAQVWVRLRIVRMGYELSTESARQTRLERLHQKLSVEHALLRNPGRLRRLAQERLGLRSARPDEVHRIQTASALFGRRAETAE